MSEYVVDFGDKKSSAFVGLAMAEAESHGATLKERIVRCRDCACFSVDDSDHDYRTGWWCKRWGTDMVKPDGFCAWASRKESE